MATHSLRFNLPSFCFVAAIAIITSVLFYAHPAGAADANSAHQASVASAFLRRDSI